MYLEKMVKPSLYPMGANFDKILEDLFNTSINDVTLSKYPAIDIYNEDDVTHIEIAVTGFSEKDIEISIEDNILYVKGNKENDETTNRKYYTRNIAKRSFIRKFSLSNVVNNISANIKDGILYIKLSTKNEKNKKQIIKINKSEQIK